MVPGFLVSARRLLTCAHVVRWADRAPVTVTFPGRRELGELSGTVAVHGGWRDGAADLGDLAVLELDREVPLAPAVFARPGTGPEPHHRADRLRLPQGVRRGHARFLPRPAGTAHLRRVGPVGGAHGARAAAGRRVQRRGADAGRRHGRRHGLRRRRRPGRARRQDAARRGHGALLAGAGRAGAHPRPSGGRPRAGAGPRVAGELGRAGGESGRHPVPGRRRSAAPAVARRRRRPHRPRAAVARGTRPALSRQRLPAGLPAGRPPRARSAPTCR
ncbi:hypothetical protein SVIOM342S_00866 [Streptomyces violaceorubidus]